MQRAIKNSQLLIKESFSEWMSDGAPRLAAALSYYTIFSLAPLLVLVIAVAGVFLGREAAQGEIINELTGVFGPEAASLIQSGIAKAGEQKAGLVASVLSLVTLVVGATGVLVELQGALNTVWKVMPKPGRGIKGFLLDRLLSLGMVLSFGFLLLVSLVVSAGLEVMLHWLGDLMPGWVALAYIANYGVALAVIALLFAVIFKWLPDAKVAWKDVWIGGFLTSALFHVGKYLIALYIGRASVASAFGAAGSLAVILVWIYYSALIVLLGAEFTRAYANHFGSPVVPDDDALPAPQRQAERLAAEKAKPKNEAVSSRSPQPATTK